MKPWAKKIAVAALLSSEPTMTKKEFRAIEASAINGKPAATKEQFDS
jgi:hypothetical protein